MALDRPRRWREAGHRRSAMTPERRSGGEVRVSGRTLSGVAMPYGTIAPDFRERFEPGAFGEVRAIDLNLQHDPAVVVVRGASLADSPVALSVSATLADGAAALALVRRGALRGFSVEFHAASGAARGGRQGDRARGAYRARPGGPAGLSGGGRGGPGAVGAAAVMAVAVLSPWPAPTATVARAAAVARLRAAVEGRAAESDEDAAALGELASARVEREAPGAPQSIRDEAVIRYAGYMAGSDYGALRGETIGPRSIEYVSNHANAWRNSGAAGLLSPWKVRRAGAIA